MKRYLVTKKGIRINPRTVLGWQSFGQKRVKVWWGVGSGGSYYSSNTIKNGESIIDIPIERFDMYMHQHAINATFDVSSEDIKSFV